MVEHKSLAAALAAAQAEFPKIGKASVNPHFHSRYTDLGDGMALVRPILAKHGLAYAQPFQVVDGTLMLRTKLLFGSEELASELPIAQPARPQDFVSLTTYYRRVGLFSLLGITPEDEDDDGNAAAELPTKPPPARRAKAPPPEPEPAEDFLIEEARGKLALAGSMNGADLREAREWLLRSADGQGVSRWMRLSQADRELRDALAAALNARAGALGITLKEAA